jgi:hypothetical protein
MRCASSAAVVDELLRHCDNVDDDHASPSTRRADFFRRVRRTVKGSTTNAIDKIALIPLHRNGFMRGISLVRINASKRRKPKNFSIESPYPRVWSDLSSDEDDERERSRLFFDATFASTARPFFRVTCVGYVA